MSVTCTQYDCCLYVLVVHIYNASILIVLHIPFNKNHAVLYCIIYANYTHAQQRQLSTTTGAKHHKTENSVAELTEFQISEYQV